MVHWRFRYRGECTVTNKYYLQFVELYIHDVASEWPETAFLGSTTKYVILVVVLNIVSRPLGAGGGQHGLRQIRAHGSLTHSILLG